MGISKWDNFVIVMDGALAQMGTEYDVIDGGTP
jgi:hypothetical protein